MINMRSFPRKPQDQPPTVLTNVSTLEIASPTPPDRSLLVHDSQSNIFSEQCSVEEFYDKDIPLEKRNIINDNNYFKQLSLSFYGEPELPQRNTLRTQTDVYQLHKASNKQMNTSLSPRSGNINEFHYGLRKSPAVKISKNQFQMSFSNMIRQVQNSQSSVRNSKVNLSQNRDVSIDRQEPKSPHLARIDFRDLKAFNIHIDTAMTSRDKTNSKGLFSQAVTGQTTCSATTPRGKKFWDSELIKEIRRPSFKKVITNSKPKPINRDYVLTEPNRSLTKSPNSSNLVPKKLKMYAVDTSNSKGLFGMNGKMFYNNVTLQDKGVPAKPVSPKGMQGLAAKRNVITIDQKISRISYYG